jgi:hypothetical protein
LRVAVYIPPPQPKQLSLRATLPIGERREVLGGPWANYVDQDKTSFENLCDVVLLYLEAATKWLETEYGTNFDTKAELGPAKLLSISDSVNATGTACNAALAALQRGKLTAFPTEKASSRCLETHR